MPPTGRMRHLTTVQGSFHGRVLAARLGAEGILVDLRGLSEGPYPLPGSVEVFVPAEQLDDAREILLADAVDEAVDAEHVQASLFAEHAASLGTLGPEDVAQPVDVPDAAAYRPIPRTSSSTTAIVLVLAIAVVVALVVVVVTAG